MAEEDDDTNSPPLADLSEAIRQRGPGVPEPDPWDRLETPPPDDAMWDRLENREVDASVDGWGRDDGPTQVWLAYSPGTIIMSHVKLPAVAFLVALAVYIAAFFRVIPERFWLLSLPLLAISAIGFIPVLAWRLGMWNPQDLD